MKFRSRLPILSLAGATLLIVATAPYARGQVLVPGTGQSVAGVGEVKVAIVWDPPWEQSRMSDEARAVLNMW